MSDARYLHLVCFLFFIATVTACHKKNANTNNTTKVFAHTLAIKYRGHLVSAIPEAIALDGNGGAVIAGYIGILHDSNNHLMFVSHISKRGKILWQKNFDLKYDYILPHRNIDIVRTQNDDFVIAGTKSYDIFLIRISAQGQIKWEKTYNRAKVQDSRDYQSKHSTVDHGNAVIQTSDGGFTVAGGSSIPYSKGKGRGRTLAILHVSNNGKRLWFTQYHHELGPGVATDIAQLPEGGYLVSGVYMNSFPFRVTPKGAYEGTISRVDIHQATYTNIIRSKNGGYVMSGWSPIYTSGNTRIILTKISSDGLGVNWSNSYGRGLINMINEMQNGDITAAGYLKDNNEKHAYFFRLDPHGNIIWKRTLDLATPSSLYGIQKTKNGGFLLIGIFNPSKTRIIPIVIRTDSFGHIGFVEKNLRPFSK